MIIDNLIYIVHTVSGEEAKTDNSVYVTMAADGVWKISLTTGSESHMGTTSDVIFYAYGSEGKVGPLTLGTGEERQHFQAGQTDDFNVSNCLECFLF